MKKGRYTITQFEAEYPDEDSCLKEVFKRIYGHFSRCPHCGKEFKYYRVNGRKCYACQHCAHQIHPLAGTIFHKSETPLKKWFYAMFLFSCSKNGVSGKELERQLGVTYKTAWRIAKQIRTLFEDDEDDTLNGVVEREGKVKAYVTQDTKRKTVTDLIVKEVEASSTIMTDIYPSYSRITL
jgi:transposase